MTDDLPRLERISVAVLDTIGPESPRAAIALSDDGAVAFTSGFDAAGRFITVIDTIGRVIGRMGHLGPGPAEVGELAALSFIPNGLVVTDIARGRIAIFSRTGEHQFSTRSLGSMMPVLVRGDSMDMVQLVSERGPPRVEVVRISLATLKGRALVSPGDSNLVALMNGSPGVASNGDKIVIGNPYSYRFLMYDQTGMLIAKWGRNIPPKLLPKATVDKVIASVAKTGYGIKGGRQALENEPQRHYLALQFDGQGRLWAQGWDQETLDSYADIFADTTFLGRVPLPCSVMGAGMAMRGDMLALLCRSNASDADVQLQLFRLVH